MSGPIAPQMTVLEITEKYPTTIEVFVESGFPKMRDPERRRAQGRSLTVHAAAKLRSIDVDELVRRLSDAAAREEQQVDVTLAHDERPTLLPAGDVRLSGLLPCPVRLPIVEAVRVLAERLKEQQVTLGWSLSAAAVGQGGLSAEIAAVQEERELPEVFVSAGFESFFDQRCLRRFKEQGTFVDLAPPGQNSAFGDLPLRDPAGHVTVLGVVPAVFLVNHTLLGGEPPPRSWEDLLTPRFTRRLALPVGDFDLFNAILLTIHRRFGDDGVRALGRAMLAARHPSQTVGRFSTRQAQQPAISVIPYFFSRLTGKAQTIQIVWPEDGAIVSPIFMLVRRATLPRARAVAELFLSREVGELIAHRGLMPVLHPEVDNRLPPQHPFLWLGWDFIADHDLGELIPRLTRLFDATVAAVAEAP
jgi:putative spermidine/putrescine transport system substrate-binding protein